MTKRKLQDESEFEEEEEENFSEEDDDSDFDAEEEEDYTPVQKKSKTSAAPRSAGGAGKSTGRAPKAPSLAQQLGVLSRDQLVDVIATLVDQGAVERDAVLGALPAPDMSKGRDEIDALRRQVDKSAPRYANYDAFHYRRVAGNLRTLKAKILELSKDYAAGPPLVALEFLATVGVPAAVSIPTFSGGAACPKSQTCKQLNTIVVRVLKAAAKLGIPQATKDRLRNVVEGEAEFEKTRAAL